MQRKVRPGSDLEQQSPFHSLWTSCGAPYQKDTAGHHIQGWAGNRPFLRGDSNGRVRSARNKTARIRRRKAPCPSQLKSILWEEMYMGLTCVRLFHPWPWQQAEIFFIGQSASRCLHGLPQPCDALQISKWAHHPLAALEWGEIPWMALIICCSSSTYVRSWRVSLLLCLNFLIYKTASRPFSSPTSSGLET